MPTKVAAIPTAPIAPAVRLKLPGWSCVPPAAAPAPGAVGGAAAGFSLSALARSVLLLASGLYSSLESSLSPQMSTPDKAKIASA